MQLLDFGERSHNDPFTAALRGNERTVRHERNEGEHEREIKCERNERNVPEV
jgi:hypothetical protein